MRLKRSFFNQKTLNVAKQLLGCFLIHKTGKNKIIGRIIETEAYCGPTDLASHASRGKTQRTQIMFGPAGHAYIYLIYGMYYCFNIVTENIDYPAAVLIRGVEIINNSKLKSQNSKVIGPGKVCRQMKIDKKYNGIDIVKSNKLWIEGSSKKTSDFTIKKLKRVGVDYAGEYKDKLWRFIL